MYPVQFDRAKEKHHHYGGRRRGACSSSLGYLNETRTPRHKDSFTAGRCFPWFPSSDDRVNMDASQIVFYHSVLPGDSGELSGYFLPACRVISEMGPRC